MRDTRHSAHSKSSQRTTANQSPNCRCGLPATQGFSTTRLSLPAFTPGLRCEIALGFDFKFTVETRNNRGILLGCQVVFACGCGALTRWARRTTFGLSVWLTGHPLCSRIPAVVYPSWASRSACMSLLNATYLPCSSGNAWSRIFHDNATIGGNCDSLFVKTNRPLSVTHVLHTSITIFWGCDNKMPILKHSGL